MLERSKTIAAVVLTSVFMNFAHGQQAYKKGSEYCSEKKMNNPDHVQEILSPGSPNHSFNVLNYKLDLDIYDCFLSPYPKSFKGINIITLRADSTLQSIQLNAVNTSLTIDSVGLAAVSFTHSSNILTLNLDRTYNAFDTVQVKIYYRHNNVSDAAFYVSSGMVFTDAEPEGARKWYPCWDKPSDKATLDLTAKVPATVKLGSNGRLADSTRVADTIWFNWKSRDPISTYLVVMSAKVNYNLDIVYWRNPWSPNDSIPIRFYWNAGENVTNLNNIKTKIIPMTTEFSRLYGVHPFEKNGFATLNNQFTWGGMENQTLTSLCPNCWSENLVSHEFAHQWMGDMITCGTWADIWLNEGFATYSEALWFEYTGGYTAYKNDINGDASGYLSSNPGWPIYNPAWAITTPNNNTLFNTAITYNKGACVLHMLRYVLGDSVFFAALKSYTTDAINFKFSTSVTADFVTKINQATGQDLSWFFDQWVYGPNHPVYQNGYYISSLGGGMWRTTFITRQTQSNAGFFKMPLQLKLVFSSGPDSTINVMNDVNNQTFTFTSDRQPTSLQFDPKNNIVLKQGTTTLGVPIAEGLPGEFNLHQNYPNPFNPATTIKYDVAAGTRVRVTVYSVLGSKVAELVNEVLPAGHYATQFDGSTLSSGVYYYRLEAGSFVQTRSLLLVK